MERWSPRCAPPNRAIEPLRSPKTISAIPGYFIYCHHSQPRAQLACLEKYHSLFPRLTLLNETPPRRSIRCGRRIGEAKTSEAKNQFNYVDIAGKGRTNVLYYNFAHEFVSMTRSQESSSTNFIWRWKQAHVVSSRGTAYLWDKNSSSNPQILGSTRYSQVVTWEERSMNSECGSDQRTSGIESYVCFRRLWISVFSETHISGTREVQAKDLSSQAMLIPDEKATVEKEWKEVRKKAHKKQKVRKVHCVALMDIRYILKYKYIPENVRKSNLDWHQWKVTGINSKSSSSEVPSLNIVEYSTWILTGRGIWITVYHCAKRKITSRICVSNLHSLPWDITSKAHKIRTTLKRRWIFKRASGNSCLHDAGEQSPTTEKKRIFQEDGIWTMIPEWHTWRRQCSRFSCLLSTPWYTSQWRNESNVLGCCTSSIENGECTKSPK